MNNLTQLYRQGNAGFNQWHEDVLQQCGIEMVNHENIWNFRDKLSGAMLGYAYSAKEMINMIEGMHISYLQIIKHGIPQIQSKVA